jgi:hypothetical protein
MPHPADTSTPSLVPDPDRLRARLAELAREQALLRRVLRAVVRGACDMEPPTSLSRRGKLVDTPQGGLGHVS